MDDDGYFPRLESHLGSILRGLEAVLADHERGEVQHFIDVGEYGIALETLGAMLVEEHIKIPSKVYSQMVDLANTMGVRASAIPEELASLVTAD